MVKIIKYIIADILKNKVVIFYTLVLALFSWTIFTVEDNTAKGYLTLMNVILLVIPLISILFSTIYLYNSTDFIELLVSQPVKRKAIWGSLFASLCTSLSIAYLIGSGICLLIFEGSSKSLLMILAGILLTCIFTALGFVSAIVSKDKAKGIGLAILIWLYFALLFDGIVLFAMFQLADYPIEKPMVLLTALNPIDLSRNLLLLQSDAAAMMGYTGAVLKQSFGTNKGLLLAFVILILWIIIPYVISLKKFKKKDL